METKTAKMDQMKIHNLTQTLLAQMDTRCVIIAYSVLVNIIGVMGRVGKVLTVMMDRMKDFIVNILNVIINTGSVLIGYNALR